RGVVPADLLDALVEYPLGHVFHAGEAIDDGILTVAALAAKGDAQRTAAQQHGGGTVAHRLVKAWIDLGLEIEVGVDVEQAWHQPFACGVYSFADAADLQAGAACQNLAVQYRQILDARHGAAAVEHGGVANQGVTFVELLHGFTPG